MHAKVFPTLLLVASVSIAASTSGAQSHRNLLSDIDALCRCTGLQRKSDVKSLQGNNVTILLSADGATEKYNIVLTDGHPSSFAPDNYRMRYELPDVKDPQRRRFCIDRVERLDKSQFSWAHFGKPDVVVDSPRGFRVRYDSSPPKKEDIHFSLGANLYFLMTPKGTVCGVFWGE